MFNLRSTKILRDLIASKTRTFLVVLTIAVGAFAVSAITRSGIILSNNLTDSYLAASPASATLFTSLPFTQEQVDAIKTIPEVRTAQGRSSLVVRVKTGKDDWRLLRLIIRPDFEVQEIYKISPQSGEWPPARGSILLERSSLAMTGLAVGDDLEIQMPTGQEHALKLSGIVYDVRQISTPFSNVAYGYITSGTYQDITTLTGFNAVDLIVNDEQDPTQQSKDEKYIRQVVEKATEKLKTANFIVTEKTIPKPLKHPLDNIIQSVLWLLRVLAVLAVFLSSLLIINSISALVAQQTRQIGTMKSVGGDSRTIAWLYINSIVIMGAVAGLFAIPGGALLARLITTFIAGLINFDITSYAVPAWVLVPELFASLLVPVLAGLAPVWSGTRITVREAISSSGSENSAFGMGLIDRLLNQLKGLPSAWLYAFRNTFRKKLRLLLALITLTAAGGIFIAVVSVRSSLEKTIDQISAYWQEDISLRFYTNIPNEKAEEIVADFDQISAVEMRLLRNSFRVRPDGSESTNVIYTIGLPASTSLITPKLVEGRWLNGEEPDEIVINVDLLAVEPGLKIGDTLTLRTAQFEKEWTIVGLVTSQVVGGELLQTPVAYANYDDLAALLESEGQANQILLTAASDSLSAAEMRQLSIDIELEFASQRMKVVSRVLNTDMRASLENAFAIILSLVQLMSILFALVGALGLAGMMSLSVLERTREIGVIRVIGAVQWTVAQIIIIEGVFIGLMSWLAGSLLAYPLSMLLNDNLGRTLLQVPLAQVFSVPGLLLWLALVIVLAALASLAPALGASRLSVRETMAFE